DDQPAPPQADEIEGRFPPVQLGPDGVFDRRGFVAGRFHDLAHAAPPVGLAARPRATPKNRAWVNSRLRPSRTTIGRVKKKAVKTSSTVDRPRKKANPRTDPTVSRYRIKAARKDTKSAARMVR